MLKAAKKDRSIAKKIKKLAIKTELKQKKQLIKERAFAEKIERKDKKQLEKALIIAKKEESKKIKNTSKIERTLVFQSELKQKKQLTRQRIIAEKMMKKAKNQLELVLTVSEKETFKKLKIRTQKEITLALKVQLAQKKLLIKQRAMAGKNAQRTKIQSDIAQIITTKQALKKARFKAKMIAYDGEVRKIYR
ncbi:MAG: hypothetical protein L3J20_07945 [Flavobacteriaceae bacterium]|nr:hypothetical protein [Flavobacteriaceae bacterium]